VLNPTKSQLDGSKMKFLRVYELGQTHRCEFSSATAPVRVEAEQIYRRQLK